MKWYKHHTDSLSDPFIEELMDKFSHSGYVAWFGLIEIICKENGNNLTGNLDITPTYLKRKLRISPTKLQQIFGFCSTNGKLLFDFSKEKWHFQFPKIAEIKDNYTKDLQVASKKLSKQKEKEKENEKEKEVDEKKNKKKQPKTSLLKDFSVSERVKKWAKEKGHVDIEEHLESFKAKVLANGYMYVDWDSAFMEAIRGDWAKLSEKKSRQGSTTSTAMDRYMGRVQ